MHYEYFTLECLRRNGYRVSDSMPQCEVLREMEPFFYYCIIEFENIYFSV